MGSSRAIGGLRGRVSVVRRGGGKAYRGSSVRRVMLPSLVPHLRSSPVPSHGASTSLVVRDPGIQG
jgi:hypothetical protein